MLLHTASEMSSSVFSLTEKKSENPAASPGKKLCPVWLRPLYESVCSGRWAEGVLGGCRALCKKHILHGL